MKLKLASLTLGIAALAGIGDAALANGYGRSAPGIRIVGAGVPVPAPAPVPEAPARWYFRADLALGIPDDPYFAERGLVLGAPPPGGSGTFSTQPGWFQHDDNIYPGYGLGVGYIFSRHLRGDITIDTRSEMEFKANAAAYSYTLGGLPINGALTDTTQLRSVVTLANLYFDFGNFGSFVPYVGGGIGFSVNELDRENSTTETAGGTSFSGKEKVHDVSLAAMGTVGLTYNIDPTIALDFNYRLLYVEGSDVSLTLNGSTSRVRIGDQLDQQLRAGVRFNVF